MLDLTRILEHIVMHLIIAHLNDIILNTTTTSEGRSCMVMVIYYLLITFTAYL